VPIIVMAAIARNGVIGRDGTMPWHLPDDMRRFRQRTMGHVLVMGRRTYESIGRPLPGRTTVVVTGQRDWPAPGPRPSAVLVASSVPEALALAASVDDAVFVQGGAQVYAEALPLADVLELTWVDGDPEGDTHFPTVDWSEWTETTRESFPGGAWVTYLRCPTALPRQIPGEPANVTSTGGEN
jgi:dihydrofolate reductase